MCGSVRNPHHGQEFGGGRLLRFPTPNHRIYDSPILAFRDCPPLHFARSDGLQTPCLAAQKQNALAHWHGARERVFQEWEFIQTPKLTTGNGQRQLTAGLKAGYRNVEHLLLAGRPARSIIQHIIIRHLSRSDGFPGSVHDPDFIPESLVKTRVRQVFTSQNLDRAGAARRIRGLPNNTTAASS